MSKLCKWKKIHSNNYGASYKCINCGDFYEEFGDGESIILPPVRKCLLANEKNNEGKK